MANDKPEDMQEGAERVVEEEEGEVQEGRDRVQDQMGNPPGGAPDIGPKE